MTPTDYRSFREHPWTPKKRSVAVRLLDLDRFAPDWVAIRVQIEFWDRVFDNGEYSIKQFGKPGVVPQADRIGGVGLATGREWVPWYVIPSKYLEQIDPSWLSAAHQLPTRAAMLPVAKALLDAKERNPHNVGSEQVLANFGFADGLRITRRHAVRWADCITTDGSAARVFGWWVHSAMKWGYEVWPAGTSVESAGGSLGEVQGLEVDENGWHIYDADGYKIPLWPDWERSEVTLVGPWHIEHGTGVDQMESCEGCDLRDALEDLAGARLDAKEAFDE